MISTGIQIYLNAARRVLRNWRRHLAIHVTATAVGSLLLWPLFALFLQRAVSLSGDVALADLDIARFLLSPVGMAVMLIAVTSVIAIVVIETSMMMAVDMADRRQTPAGSLAALRFTFRSIFIIIRFGLLLAIKVILLSLPALALAAVVAWYFLTSHDINYYLAQHPPEFMIAAGLIGLVLLVAGTIIALRLIRWTLALPLTLFAHVPPSMAFQRSAHIVRTSNPGVTSALIAWALASFALSTLAGSFLYLLGDSIVPLFDHALRRQALALGAVALIWLVVQTMVQAFSGAVLAVSLNSLVLRADPDIMSEARIPVSSYGTGDGPSGWVVGGIVAAAVVAGSIGGSLSLIRSVRLDNDVQIIAHRAGAYKAPENTMAAVEMAIADGADWLEIDVQEISDGTVVVIHDRDFMRQAGDPVEVYQATAADLRRLDIGSWFDPAFSGERTMTLTDVLVASKGRTRVLIELKYYGKNDRLEERVAKAVEDTDMQESIAIMSLERNGIMRMRELRPDWPIGLLTARAFGDITKIGADFLAVNSAMVNSRLVRRTHAADQTLHVWTINDAGSMSDMISAGVDGLITDRPALAKEVLAQRKDLDPLHKLVLIAGSRMGLTD